MDSRNMKLVGALSVLGLPALLSAADTAQKDAIATVNEGLATGITALVVFGLVFAVLSVKVWPTITKGLHDRAEKIKSEIEAAEAARAQARAALEQYEKSLADARVEAQKEIDKARASAQAIGAELKARNETEIQAMKAKALAEIEAAKRLALSEIYSEAADLSTSVAGKILRRDITSNDQQRLVDDALAELRTAGAR
ncbi:MAG: F0F1 ATP synthase subunit B [Phycisphaerales bacterium]